MSLAAWEKSTLREIVDLAFDAAVIRAKELKAIQDMDEEHLRQQILPRVFISITERIEWSVDAEGNVREEHRQIIEAEIERHLLVELEQNL